MLAAFFDGEFNIDWLQELTGEKASTIFAALELGVERGWLSRSNLSDFSFIDQAEQKRRKQELPEDEKAGLHKSIAGLLIRNLPGGPGQTRRVASHLLHIENSYDGCRLLLENGNIHRREFRDEKARLYYNKAIDDLRKLSGRVSDRLFVETTLEYAKVSADTDNPARVISILEEAISRAGSIGDMDSIGFLKMHLGKSEWLRSRYKEALACFKQGWEMTRSTCDPSMKKSIKIFGMFFHYWSGGYREVVNIYETLFPDVEDRFPKGRLPLLAALTAGVCLGHTGLYSQSMGMLNSIRAHGRAIGNLSIAGLAGVSMGYLLLELNRPEDAVLCILDSWEETEKSRSLYARLGGLILLSYAYHLTGEQKRAVSCLLEYLEISQQSRMTVKYSAVMLLICQAMEEEVFPRVEGVSLDDEIRYSLESGNLLMKGVALRHKAVMLRKADCGGQDALGLLEQSISELEKCGHQIELAKSKVEMAREYIRMGFEKKAVEYAEPAARTLNAFNEALVPDDIRPLIKELGYANKCNKSLEKIPLKEMEKLLVLVEKADILIETFEPGLMDSLGIGCRQLREVNPGLIYLAITPYGQYTQKAKEMTSMPWSDLTSQAESGMAALIGGLPDEPEPFNQPIRAGFYAGGYTSAVSAVCSTLMALFFKRRTSEGQMVDVATADSYSSCVGFPPTIGYVWKTPRPRYGTLDYGLCPYGFFKCKDGYVAIACFRDQDFRAALRILGLWRIEEDWKTLLDRITDDIERAKKLNREIENAVAEMTFDEIFNKFQAFSLKAARSKWRGGGMPVTTRMLRPMEVMEVEHWKVRNTFFKADDKYYGIFQIPVTGKMSQTPLRIKTISARIGEHTDLIFEKYGLT